MFHSFTSDGDGAHEATDMLEFMSSNSISIIIVCSFFFLITGYIEKKFYQKKVFNLLSDDKSSETFNHSRICPTHRSISNSKYVRQIRALNYH